MTWSKAKRVWKEKRSRRTHVEVIVRLLGQSLLDKLEGLLIVRRVNGIDNGNIGDAPGLGVEVHGEPLLRSVQFVRPALSHKAEELPGRKVRALEVKEREERIGGGGGEVYLRSQVQMILCACLGAAWSCAAVYLGMLCWKSCGVYAESLAEIEELRGLLLGSASTAYMSFLVHL